MWARNFSAHVEIYADPRCSQVVFQDGNFRLTHSHGPADGLTYWAGDYRGERCPSRDLLGAGSEQLPFCPTCVLDDLKLTLPGCVEQRLETGQTRRRHVRHGTCSEILPCSGK